VIQKLAALVESFPEIMEIEINPVIVTHEDTWAVDAKVILI
jgi:succinyl-CoA synthetase beta subunit